MSKKMYNKTLDFLKQKLQKNGEIEGIERYEDIFLTINSFSENNDLDDARKVIDYVIDKQNRKGIFEFNEFLNEEKNINPVYFLNSINKYLHNFKQKNQIKRYIKYIRRSIDFLENNFDEDYLLLFDLDFRDRKIFFTKQNAIFLSFADELAQILNEFDYNKDADKIFLLKSKIELGFIRYFYYKKESVLIKSFIPKIEKIEQLNNLELIDILNIYNFDENLYNKFISILNKEIINQTNTNKILFSLIDMKKNKNKDFKKYFEKFDKYLLEFPKLIVLTKNISFFEEIKKSLFSNYISKNIEIKKYKITLIDIGNISVANLLLKLLK